MPTGYEPLQTLKPVGPHIWLADGPLMRFYGLPFPTRMVVVRLADCGLFTHPPMAPGGTLPDAHRPAARFAGCCDAGRALGRNR